MLIKPLNAFLKEVVDPTTQSYLGQVEDNNDPEKLGRLKVRISPYMDFQEEDLPWASPVLGSHGNSPEYGGVNIPEIGSQVRVYFPSHDITAPYYTGAELNQLNRTTFFDEDYPDVYGYKDSTGNFVKVNKATKTVQFQHSSSSNLKVAPDGSMQISLSNGAYFTFSNQNNFELNTGMVNIKGIGSGILSVNADSEIDVSTNIFRLSANDITLDGNVKASNGATGSFYAVGKLVTVEKGIIVSIT